MKWYSIATFLKTSLYVPPKYFILPAQNFPQFSFPTFFFLFFFFYTIFSFFCSFSSHFSLSPHTTSLSPYYSSLLCPNAATPTHHPSHNHRHTHRLSHRSALSFFTPLPPPHHTHPTTHENIEKDTKTQWVYSIFSSFTWSHKVYLVDLVVFLSF